MTQQTQITFKDKLWYNESFQKDKAQRRLSKLIDLLLSAHYNISEDDEQITLTQVEEKLNRINAEKANLLKEKEIIEKKAEEEKARYLVIE